MKRLLSVLSVLAVLLFVTCAHVAAQAHRSALDRGRAAYLDADFDQARTLYRSVLDADTLDRAGALEALRYLIALDALLGDTDAARGHARSAVALDPQVTVPEGAPDDAVTLLDEARAAAGSSRLDITSAEPLAPGTPTTVILAYPGGPRSLIHELHLRCEGTAGAHDATGSMPEVRLETPETSGDLSCSGEARTEHGAVLAHASEVLSRSAAAPTTTAEGSGPDLALILGVTGAVVAVVVIAVVIGVVVGTTPSGTSSFAPAQVCGAGWSTC